MKMLLAMRMSLAISYLAVEKNVNWYNFGEAIGNACQDSNSDQTVPRRVTVTFNALWAVFMGPYDWDSLY